VRKVAMAIGLGVAFALIGGPSALAASTPSGLPPLSRAHDAVSPPERQVMPARRAKRSRKTRHRKARRAKATASFLENQSYAFNTGGYVQHHPHVHVIFWGSQWNQYPGTKEKVLAFYQWVGGSSIAQAMTQYFDAGGYISGQSDLTASFTDTRVGYPAGPMEIGTSTPIKNEIHYAIQNVAGFAHTGGVDDQYVVLTPPGTKHTTDGCGWHGYEGEPWSVVYAYVQWPSAECLRGLELWATIQVVESHEYFEAESDPIPYEPYEGWNVPAFWPAREIADMCNDHTAGERFEGAAGIWVAKVWDDYRLAKGESGCTAGEQPDRVEAATGGYLVGSKGKATVFGTVRRGGFPARYRFELKGPGGTVVSPASYTEVGPPEFGGPAGMGTTFEGLASNTSYRYKLSAFSYISNPSLTLGGGIALPDGEVEFVTPPWLEPTITTEAPTGVSAHNATLHASINPQGSATSYHFEYGTTTSYGQSAPVPDAAIGSGTTAVKVSRELTGLLTEHTYHYRVVAANSEGTTTSADQTFTTLANAPTFVSSFGGKGTGNGQFTSPVGTVMSPGGIVVGGNGNLYATDAGGNRVEKFGPAGEYLSQFGTGGSGNGQFNAPLGIALDPAGHLFVADANNHRIEEVSANGAFIAQFGPGEGSEPLYAPWDVVADKAGHIFAADPIRGAVYEYSVEGLGPEGNHLLAVIPYTLAEREGRSPIGLGYEPGGGNVWGVDANKTYVEQYMLNCGGCAEHPALFTRFGTEGSGLGQLKQPYDVAVRPSGSLLVLDHGNNRVEQFSQAGELLANFGAAGSGAGQLNQPFSIAYGKGSIYVADSGNNRIERWTQVGPPEAITQAATAIGSNGATLNALIAPVGASTAYHFEYGTTTAYGTKAPAPDESVGSGFEAVAKAKAISGLTPGTTYHYRAVATSSEGTAYGEDMTFTTAP
jgi:hypothetical protein